MKQLYAVRIEVEFMVVAKSVEDAKRIAVRSVGDEASNLSWWDFDAAPADEPITGWHVNMVPYGQHDGKTVGEWIVAGQEQTYD